jgi:hypothetical protein
MAIGGAGLLAFVSDPMRLFERTVASICFPDFADRIETASGAVSTM